MDKENNRIVLGLKALFTGAFMTVPGVSGGATAMVLGEYDHLISAIPGLLKKSTFKSSFVYLLIFGLCGIIGVVLASKPMSFLISNYQLPVMYFIIGTIIGSVPMVVRKSQIERFRVKDGFFILIGIAAIVLISLLPEGILNPSMNMTISSILIQIIGGIGISVGFVLPGVSMSYLLVVLGLYEPVLNMIGNLDILPLIPLGLGMVIGVFLLAGFLKWAMEKKSEISFMIILGFLLASIIPLYPGLPSSISIFVVSFISFLAGSTIILLLTKG